MKGEQGRGAASKFLAKARRPRGRLCFTECEEFILV
jgi:hypothetical protein